MSRYCLTNHVWDPGRQGHCNKRPTVKVLTTKLPMPVNRLTHHVWDVNGQLVQGIKTAAGVFVKAEGPVDRCYFHVWELRGGQLLGQALDSLNLARYQVFALHKQELDIGQPNCSHSLNQ